VGRDISAEPSKPAIDENLPSESLKTLKNSGGDRCKGAAGEAKLKGRRRGMGSRNT